MEEPQKYTTPAELDTRTAGRQSLRMVAVVVAFAIVLNSAELIQSVFRPWVSLAGVMGWIGVITIGLVLLRSPARPAWHWCVVILISIWMGFYAVEVGVRSAITGPTIPEQFVLFPIWPEEDLLHQIEQLFKKSL